MRRIVVILTSTALLLGGAVAVAGSAAAKKPTIKIVAPAVVESGVALKLALTVTKGAAGQKARVQVKVGKKWRAVTTKKLPKSGKLTVSLSPTLGTFAYRVTLAKKGSSSAATSRKVTVGVVPRLSITAPLQDAAFTVSGRLPSNVKRSVALQRRVGAAWVSTAVVTSSAKGVVAFSTSAVERGTYRLYAPRKNVKKKTYAPFASRTRTIAPQTRLSLVAAGNGSSGAPSVSADGRFVAFDSQASSFVTGDKPYSDIFVKNLATGTVRAVTAGNEGSFQPVISADGRFVVFQSYAEDLVAGDAAGKLDIFLWEAATGALTLVSRQQGGGPANESSYAPTISADGGRVVFESDASNLVAADTNNARDVFVWTRASQSATRVSVTSAGGQANGSSYRAAVSPDGAHVAFSSEATNLVGGDTNGAADVFVRNLGAGTTRLVSRSASGGAANGVSENGAVSSGGRYVAYGSWASNIAAADGNNAADAFVWDSVTGRSTKISRSTSGGNAAYGTNAPTAISADGASVVFSSTASNLVVGDAGVVEDVFVWRRSTGSLAMVSRAASGAAGTGRSSDGRISSNGRWIVFSSRATNLNGGGSVADILRYDNR